MRFEWIARDFAERTALRDSRRQFSYRELNVAANKIAQGILRECGHEVEQVALLMESGLPMIVGVLAACKSGKIAVPLDAAYPKARQSYMLENSEAGLLVCDSATHSRAREIAGEGVRILNTDALPAGILCENPGIEVSADSACLLLYTSGSTGHPKGIVQTHRNVLHTCMSYTNTLGISPDDCISHLHSTSFSAGITEVFWGILNGAQVSVWDVRARGFTGLRRWLADERISLLHWVPTSFRHLFKAEFDQVASSVGEEFPAARLLVLGSEAVTRRDVELWREHFPADSLFVCRLGSTEASNYRMFFIDRETEFEGTVVPVGYPFGGKEVLLLDDAGKPVKPGEIGEVAIRSEYLSPGYWRRPDLTAASFLSDPEGGLKRVFRSGDLGVMRPDGCLEYLGRKDSQVKIRGQRVEIAEIESTLLGIPGIKQAAVTAHDDTTGEKYLAAYVVPTGAQPPSVGMLRQSLTEKLPGPMIPAAFVTLDALPLTTSGKVDRKALPLPGEVHRPNDREWVAPRTAVEEALSEIWAEVLGLERVGVTDHFFELGGHSLNALQVVSKVRSVLRVELSLSSLVEHPTVAQLAEVVEDRRAGEWDSDSENTAALSRAVPGSVTATADKAQFAITLHPEQRHEPFPLNDIQQAYWIGRSGLVELGNVSTHRYMEVECVDIDLSRLEAAWRKLIERHDMLRAIVQPDGRQCVLKQVPPYQIKTLDVRGRDSREAEEAIASVRERMSHQVLPSDRWPIFELFAVLIDDRTFRLHMSFDALILDLRSRLILFEEWQQLYHYPEAMLEPLELTFRDYLLAEESQRETPRYRAAEAYWRKRLDSLPSHPDLPLAKEPEAIEKSRFVRRAARLEAGIWSRLKARANQSGLTPSGLLLSAFTEVLRVWSRNPKFSVNLTFLDRKPGHPDVEKIVGDFTSLLLLEVDHSRPGTFESKAKRLQQQLWRDLDHLEFNGLRVLRELAKSQSGELKAAMPIVFTSALAYDSSKGGAALSRWLGKSVFDVSQTPQVWLDHVVLEDAGALSYSWDAVEELFPAGMIDDMFAAYHALLNRLASDDDTWQELSHETATGLLPDSQRRARDEANATDAPIPAGLLHSRFAEQAALRPNHPAVITGETTLSYRELLDLSRRIGRKLRQTGVQPNQLVAVVMEKGWEQVAAVLGILESGAAYLPIDATLPKDRQWQILEDGRVQVALTQTKFESTLEWPANLIRFAVNDDAQWTSIDAAALQPVQTPDDLAYVIYTSGSSGRPKGVVIDHRGALNTVVDVNSRFEVGPNDKVLALSSLSFDLSVYDVFGLLIAGGTIMIPEADAVRNPARWAELVERYGITLWNSVPALVELLVEHLEGRNESFTRSLRVVMMSGDWIPTNLPDRIRKQFGDIRLISMGGATEASIWSIIYEIGEVDPSWKSIPYGKGMLNQSFHVYNDRMEPCPVWVPGQLHIGGIGLAKGYWGDEARTNAAFITHPHTGERLYKTGDLGRFLPDANIEFLGREDFQVKIRGNRIELGDIEAALMQHASVKAAVVSAVGPSRTEKRLVAYVIPNEGENPQPEEMRQFLLSKLPAYMVPGSYMLLDRFPLSSNGKVDRKALPAPEENENRYEDASATAEATTVVDPATQETARIVAQVLGVERLAVDANLLNLGATSIDMIRIVNAVEKAFGFRPKIGDFYRQPTVRWLHTARKQSAMTSAPAMSQQGAGSSSAGANIDWDAFEEGTL